MPTPSKSIFCLNQQNSMLARCLKRFKCGVEWYFNWFRCNLVVFLVSLWLFVSRFASVNILNTHFLQHFLSAKCSRIKWWCHRILKLMMFVVCWRYCWFFSFFLRVFGVIFWVVLNYIELFGSKSWLRIDETWLAALENWHIPSTDSRLSMTKDENF